MRKDERDLLEAFSKGELLLLAAQRLRISVPRLKNICQKWLDFGYVRGAKVTEAGKEYLRDG